MIHVQKLRKRNKYKPTQLSYKNINGDYNVIITIIIKIVIITIIIIKIIIVLRKEYYSKALIKVN